LTKRRRRVGRGSCTGRVRKEGVEAAISTNQEGKGVSAKLNAGGSRGGEENSAGKTTSNAWLVKIERGWGRVRGLCVSNQKKGRPLKRGSYLAPSREEISKEQKTED